jgi:hypothetical protein
MFFCFSERRLSLEDRKIKEKSTDPKAGQKKFLLNLLWILGVLLCVALISRQFFLGKFTGIFPEKVWMGLYVSSFVLFWLGVMVGLFAFGLLFQGDPLKDFRPLKDYFQGSFPNSPWPVLFNGEHKGMSFSIYYSRGGQEGAPSFEFVITKEFSGRVVIVSKSLTNTLSQIFSNDPEILTGDPDFDAKFLVKAEFAEKIKPVITRSEIKGSIRDIFERKFGSIKVTKTEIRFWKSYFRPAELERENMIFVMDRIVQIAEGLS